MKPAYYNENDRFAAQWLRNLIGKGLIAPGDVDERSIVDVRPDDLVGYRQCHFFAGIGGWSRALRIAGWPDDNPVWTGSCPCQPLSVAGQQRGHADERHLWPAFYNLIAERKPPVCFGEQVGSKIGREWLAGVRADLEGAGYACGAADLCAAGVGAPHRRQRLYWVAMADAGGGRVRDGGRPEAVGATREVRGEIRQQRVRPDAGANDLGQPMADADSSGHRGRPEGEIGRAQRRDAAQRADGELVDAAGERRREGRAEPSLRGGRDAAAGTDEPGALEHPDGGRRARGRGREIQGGREANDAASPDQGGCSFWSDAEWISCADGKARRAKRGIRLLVDGLQRGVGGSRVGRWRGYGNAIVPHVAAEFISAATDAMSGPIHSARENHI